MHLRDWPLLSHLKAMNKLKQWLIAYSIHDRLDELWPIIVPKFSDFYLEKEFNQIELMSTWRDDKKTTNNS